MRWDVSSGLQNRCSIRLSYGTKSLKAERFFADTALAKERLLPNLLPNPLNSCQRYVL
jgi:hypothetical protein